MRWFGGRKELVRRRRWPYFVAAGLLLVTVLGWSVPPRPSVAVRAVSAGGRDLLASGELVGCVQVFPVGSYLTGLADLALPGHVRGESLGVLWQFPAKLGFLGAPSVPWPMVVWWLHGWTVLSSQVVRSGSLAGLAVPAGADRAAGLPASETPVFLPTSMGLGASCVPG